MTAKTKRSEANGGLIIREREPVNLEYPFDQLDEFLTPNDLFYIRSHFKAPQLDRDSYQLSLDGAVKQPFTISYKDLLLDILMAWLATTANLDAGILRSHF